MKTYDSWDLNTLREAAEFNRANPDPEDQGAIDWVEAELAAAEAQRLHVTSTPVADESPFSGPRGNGHTNYGAQQAIGASEAQERFIRSLCAERGVDADALLATIKTKGDASKAIDKLKAQKPAAAKRSTTPRQLEFLQDLLSTRVHDHTTDGTDLDFETASAMIDELLRAPKAGKVKTTHGIRHGHYAWDDAEGVTHFYRVAQDGKLFVIAGPQEHPYNGQLNEALLAIQADPQAAAALYGRAIGRCGRCHLRLSDKTSRERGLGPDCASKTDW